MWIGCASAVRARDVPGSLCASIPFSGCSACAQTPQGPFCGPFRVVLLIGRRLGAGMSALVASHGHPILCCCSLLPAQYYTHGSAAAAGSEAGSASRSASRATARSAAGSAAGSAAFAAAPASVPERPLRACRIRADAAGERGSAELLDSEGDVDMVRSASSLPSQAPAAAQVRLFSSFH